MNKRKFLSILISINLSLTIMGCSRVDTNTKDYSLNQIEIIDDMLTDVETDLDFDFDEPLIIVDRPYEFIIDYRYLNDYDTERVKIAKLAFEKDFSTKSFGRTNVKFFRDYCLRKLQIKNDNPDLYQKMYTLLKEGIIDIDLNIKKLINTEDAIYLLDAEITFNKDYDNIKKGEVIRQKYVLSSDENLLAYQIDAFGKQMEEGLINDAIMNIDLTNLDSQIIYWEDIPVIEEYLYFNIDKLKKSNRM